MSNEREKKEQTTNSFDSGKKRGKTPGEVKKGD